MKLCRTCNTTKALTEFSKDKWKSDGLTSNCKVCRRASNASQRKWRRDEILAKRRSKYAENPEKERIRRNRYVKANPERCREINKACRDRNPELHKARSRLWSKSNPERVAAASGKRRAARLLRIPGWLTQSDLDRISFIYKLAKMLSQESGVVHHVDHIYPLQGEYVSGLHTPDNLQILTASDNCKKHNKWVPE